MKELDESIVLAAVVAVAFAPAFLRRALIRRGGSNLQWRSALTMQTNETNAFENILPGDKRTEPSS